MFLVSAESVLGSLSLFVLIAVGFSQVNSNDSNIRDAALSTAGPPLVRPETKCSSLNSATTTAKCFRLGRWVSCDSSVLPGTRATIWCRTGYSEATDSKTIQSGTVECNKDGKWEPDPVTCIPACGSATNDTATDFPWHASIYLSSPDVGGKSLSCSATIIRNNLVLTAASCVWDSQTNSTIDAKRLFVITGNKFQDYDHAMHDPEAVWKSGVRGVYMNCDYKGEETSLGDIALVETKDSFPFSSLRLPACWDEFGLGVEPILPGEHGSIAEFGSTSAGQGSLTTNEDVPVIKTVPFVPHDECKASDKIAIAESLTSDKFCAGYSNRSSICATYRGGGLVFKKHDLWYVMGIVSVTPFLGLWEGSLKCKNYAIYTNVSEYTAWIADVIFNLERHKSHPPCESDGSTPILTSKIGEPNNNGSLPSDEAPSCSAPLQPNNGRWVFHKSLCANETDCKMLQGAPLRPGTLLIYKCAPGYRAKGNTEVYCGFNGNWSTIPVCVQIKCESPNSVSTAASCYNRFNEWMSCDSGVPPGARAEVFCHLGYRKDTSISTFQRETVRCGEDGRWTPDPIRCVPVCGIATTHQTPFVASGVKATLSDFPWHATLYLQKTSSRGVKKEFICGGTIIQTNFVLTAAHCVYDETAKTTTDPGKLFLMTGNIFRDYDSPLHNPVSVKKSAVTNIYRPCKYYGIRGNYASDIALLELESPFTFSNVLSPACLDVENYGEQLLEPGAYGRVAGFGRTSTGVSSGILQTLTLPYISYNQCKASKNAARNDVLISSDKFCAGYTNGSAVCEGDSGGGLVFRKSEQWYVLGIVSVGLGVDLANGEKTCDRYAYSLYTKVSEHMSWIQDVLFRRAQGRIYPSCSNQA